MKGTVAYVEDKLLEYTIFLMNHHYILNYSCPEIIVEEFLQYIRKDKE